MFLLVELHCSASMGTRLVQPATTEFKTRALLAAPSVTLVAVS